MRRQFYILFFAALALMAYLLPWVVNPSTALTLSAYDLAEWLSLHPASRTSLMLPPLLLRLPLVFIVLLVVFNTGIPRWLRAIIAGIGVIALLPPFEFLSSLSDPNYQQQFALAAITFVFGTVGLTDRLRSGVALVVLLIGLVGVSLWGNISAYNMMVAYRLPVQYGLGGVLLAVFSLVHLLWIAKRGNSRTV